jgi:hypothetical protein
MEIRFSGVCRPSDQALQNHGPQLPDRRAAPAEEIEHAIQANFVA